MRRIKNSKEDYEDKNTQWPDTTPNGIDFIDILDDAIIIGINTIFVGRIKFFKNLDGSYSFIIGSDNKKIFDLAVKTERDDNTYRDWLYIYTKLPKSKTWNFEGSIFINNFITNDLSVILRRILAEYLPDDYYYNYIFPEFATNLENDARNFPRNLDRISEKERIRFLKSLLKKNPRKNAKTKKITKANKISKSLRIR